ncbi:hypothetical protein LCGC14_1750460, partial [marine sediment metagenome]
MTGKDQTSRENVIIQVEKIKNRLSSLSQKDIRQTETIENLLNGDFGFARISKIKNVPASKDHVYCFEVSKNYPGFVAGAGGIFTHNCFGYLGYRNARWGRIDAHESINAYAREKILKIIDLAEENNLECVA